jgi:hypothetical protein
MSENEMEVAEKKIKLDDDKKATTSHQNDDKFLEYDNFSQFFDVINNYSFFWFFKFFYKNIYFF